MNAELDVFGQMLDRTGLSLTGAQKDLLFKAWPMFQAMVARASAPLPREAEPAVIFQPGLR